MKRQEQKFYHDRGCYELPPLDMGDNVRIRQGSNWQPGRVVGFDKNPRSVMVHSNGRTYRRNRKHLLKSREIFTENDLSRPVEHSDFDYMDPMNSDTGKGGNDHNPVNPPIPCANEQSQIPTRNPTVAPPVPRTSRGREIKEPVRFKDYLKT